MAFPFLTGQKLPASDLNSAFYAVLSNFVAQNSVATNQTTASASYVDLATAGPAVTLTSHGTLALIMWSQHASNNTANCGAISSIAISGATTLAVADGNGILWTEHGTQSDEVSQWMLATITPGSNTYTMKYKRAAGGTASFERRRIMVWAP